MLTLANRKEEEEEEEKNRTIVQSLKVFEYERAQNERK
jgi:hypothetical protein